MQWKRKWLGGVKTEKLFLPQKMKELNKLLEPILKETWLKKKWEIAQKNARNSLKYANDIQMLLNIINLTEGIRILDVGCGLGIEIIEFANLGANCVGLEAEKTYAKVITAIGKKFKIKVRGDFGNGCDLPYENETFDVVISKSYFEHVKDFNLAIREQTRVLKRNGKLVVIDGNLFNPVDLYTLLIEYPLRTHGKHGGLKWLFTKSKVREKIYSDIKESSWTGKDEDVHTIFWWKRKMREYKDLKIIDITTTKAYKEREKAYSAFLKPFWGAVLVICSKV